MSLLEGIGIALLIGGGAWIGHGALQQPTPEPQYIEQEMVGGTSIRRYENLKTVIAQNEEDNRAFRQLFQYISGENERQEKIPMTAPVLMNEEGQTAEGGLPDTKWLAFIMPDTDNPPPTNTKLSQYEFTKLTVAVRSFSGHVRAKRAELIENQIRKDLEKSDYKPSEGYLIAQYHSPYVFPLFRKNEIWVILRDKNSTE